MVVRLIHHSKILQQARLVQICVALEVFLFALQMHDLNIRIQIPRLTSDWFILLSSLRSMNYFIRSWAWNLIYLLRLRTSIYILAMFIVKSLFKRYRVAALWTWVLKCVLHSNYWTHLFLVLNPKMVRTQSTCTISLMKRVLLVVFKWRESTFRSWQGTFLLHNDANCVVFLTSLLRRRFLGLSVLIFFHLNTFYIILWLRMV